MYNRNSSNMFDSTITTTQFLSACRDINIGRDSITEYKISLIKLFTQQKSMSHSVVMGSQIFVAIVICMIYFVFRYIMRYVEQEKWSRHFPQPPKVPFLGIFLSIPKSPVGESMTITKLYTKYHRCAMNSLAPPQQDRKKSS